MRFFIQTIGIILICLNLIILHIAGSTAAPLDTVDSTKSQQQLTADMVNTLKYENSNIGIDGYDFAFETSDGVLRKETATVKNIGTEEEAISVEGTVSWVGPDGVQYTLNYLADENGFQPEGKHLPVGPES
ncbi:endocuticle structural protein SgAbd-6-like [Lucilia cuprina]|uniref:endocuticle structural protein SgAbd-6-like n=1 Tax=Lucilia cuprina TaxID=7375 RepID=UPI000C71AD08|nr:endocuticle structural protein SgAbd-6-like [Lucilia cuprina]